MNTEINFTYNQGCYLKSKFVVFPYKTIVCEKKIKEDIEKKSMCSLSHQPFLDCVFACNKGENAIFIQRRYNNIISISPIYIHEYDETYIRDMVDFQTFLFKTNGVSENLANLTMTTLYIYLPSNFCKNLLNKDYLGEYVGKFEKDIFDVNLPQKMQLFKKVLTFSTNFSISKKEQTTQTVSENKQNNFTIPTFNATSSTTTFNTTATAPTFGTTNTQSSFGFGNNVSNKQPFTFPAPTTTTTTQPIFGFPTK